MVILPAGKFWKQVPGFKKLHEERTMKARRTLLLSLVVSLAVPFAAHICPAQDVYKRQSWNKPKFDTPPGRRGLRILNSMDSRISAEL